jgi:hypothetical protein
MKFEKLETPVPGIAKPWYIFVKTLSREDSRKSRVEGRQVKGEEGSSSRRSRLWIEEGRGSSSSRSKTRAEVEPLRGSRDKAANLASLKSQGGGSNA